MKQNVEEMCILCLLEGVHGHAWSTLLFQYHIKEEKLRDLQLTEEWMLDGHQNIWRSAAMHLTNWTTGGIISSFSPAGRFK